MCRVQGHQALVGRQHVVAVVLQALASASANAKQNCVQKRVTRAEEVQLTKNSSNDNNIINNIRLMLLALFALICNLPLRY
jgi:hypothetical protein